MRRRRGIVLGATHEDALHGCMAQRLPPTWAHSLSEGPRSVQGLGLDCTIWLTTQAIRQMPLGIAQEMRVAEAVGAEVRRLDGGEPLV